ncbi:MAG: hypothetical protein JWM86_950 [Thermoleophilia bacterium]|nr:hypothetical protein [Thermoleophilia bacterium]
MSEHDHGRAEAIALVERWIDSFNGGWPTDETFDELLTADAVFVERPNLVNPAGSERDIPAMRAGVAAGQGLLADQRYDIDGHVVDGDTVATRMRWRGTLAINAAAWKAGTVLSAFCVAHYTLRDGRIARIEQHDCYGAPQPPAPRG